MYYTTSYVQLGKKREPSFVSELRYKKLEQPWQILFFLWFFAFLCSFLTENFQPVAVIKNLKFRGRVREGEILIYPNKNCV